MLVGAAQDAGYAVSDVVCYPSTPATGWLIEELERRLVRILLPLVQPGDVLAIAYAARPWHVALVSQLEPLTIIHSYRTVGRCVEQPLDPAMRRRLHSAWRLPYG